MLWRRGGFLTESYNFLQNEMWILKSRAFNLLLILFIDPHGDSLWKTYSNKSATAPGAASFQM